MEEYIDRVNALSYLKEKYNEMNGMNAWYYAGFQHAVGLLENVQKSDAAKVVHGKWIKRDGYTECSECEYWYDSPDSEDSGDRSKYCPHCGAKMEK